MGGNYGFLDLPDEILSDTLRYTGNDHALAVALTCQRLAHEARRNAQNDARRRLEQKADAAEPAKLYRTPVRAVVNTVELCAWARDAGYWSASVCAFAAAAGNLEVLQWARQHGCPWDWRTYEWARDYHHIKQWAEDNDCKWKLVFPSGRKKGEWVRVHPFKRSGWTQAFLNLNSSGITSISLDIGLIADSLRELYLSDNELTELPPEIGSLYNLEKLDIRGNKLTTLPREFAGLLKLRTLLLDENRLAEFPLVVCELMNLQVLYLRKNKLSHLPSKIANLEDLAELDLSGNRISTFPPELAQMMNLRQVNLTDNPMHSVPQEFLLERPDVAFLK